MTALYYARVLRTMIIGEGGEDKPVLALATLDKAWVMVLGAANVLPLLWWSVIDGWAHGSLTL